MPLEHDAGEHIGADAIASEAGVRPNYISERYFLSTTSPWPLGDFSIPTHFQ
jgi:hypothetical protein